MKGHSDDMREQHSDNAVEYDVVDKVDSVALIGDGWSWEVIS